MSWNLENYGLDFDGDSETLSGFVGYLLQQGKALETYHGLPYLFTPIGVPESWITLQHKEDGDDMALEVDRLNMHSTSDCLWEVVCFGSEVGMKDPHGYCRTFLFNRKNDGGGMLPIEVITADVLPGLMEGDIVKLQVVALPSKISYYPDMDAYADSVPEQSRKRKLLIAEGSLFPSGFMYNHDVNRPEEEKDYSLDAEILFTAKVKKLMVGFLEIGEERQNTFVRCVAETQFGDLEFVHTVDQVPEELRENMKVSAIISGICVISGDAALYEYENGIVRDEEHDLRLLRSVMQEGDAERLRSIMEDDVLYDSESGGVSCYGSDEIIERLNDVNEERKGEYRADLAVITKAAEDSAYPVGTRCLALSVKGQKGYESIAFIKVSGRGDISEIYVTTDSSYSFRVDEPFSPEEPVDFPPPPDRVEKTIIARAKFYRMIDEKMEEEQILDGITGRADLERNAGRMLQYLEDHPQEDQKEALENVFGYLFARAYLRVLNSSLPEAERFPETDDSPENAAAGELGSLLPEEQYKGRMDDLGHARSFCKDAEFLTEVKELSGDDIDRVFLRALVLTQHLGELCAEKDIREDGNPETSD